MASIIDKLSDDQLLRILMDFITDNIKDIERIKHVKPLDFDSVTRDDIYNFMKSLDISKEQLVDASTRKGINLQGVALGGIILNSNIARTQHLYLMKHQLSLMERDGYKTLRTVPDPISSNFISIKSSHELIKVDSLKDLKKGQINHGSVIYCKVVEPVYQVVGLQCLVEDSSKQSFLLTIYNLIPPESSWDYSKSIIPLNSIIAVKEPYVKCFNSGYLGLRVDHPKNIEIVPPSIQKKDDDDECDLKKKGNNLFALCKYDEAMVAYSTALTTIIDDNLKVTLLSNRAACCLKLLMYERA